MSTPSSVRTANTQLTKMRAAERRRRALSLRKAGMSVHEIADALGIQRAKVRTVRKILDEALREVTIEAGAAEVLQLELARLDEATKTVFLILRDPQAGYDQKLRSIDRLLAIMARRAKYLGLDSPEKIQMDMTTEHVETKAVVIAGDPAEYGRMLSRVRAEIEASQTMGLEPPVIEAEIVTESAE